LRKTYDSDPELEVFRVKEEVANLEIARKCLSYLENGALTNKGFGLMSNIRHLKAFPLLSYTALHWHEHARFLARSADVFDLSRPFYHKKSQICMSWFKAYWIEDKLGCQPNSFTRLHLASYLGILPLGILPLAENLVLTKGSISKMKRLRYLNKIDYKRRTALMWVAEFGHETVVRLLLEKGAGIEAKDKHGETALIKAAESGYEAVIQLLLEKGADIEAEGGFKETALTKAARHGHKAVVRLLTPLDDSCKNGHIHSTSANHRALCEEP
jgi:ankyrin repeat protein